MASSFASAPPMVAVEPEKRIGARGKEPSRRKTHWDYVLQEMAWLAKDFESERKMKLSQAKRMAVKVSKCGLHAESKGLRRQKEEEQRMRRLAGNIAKEVKKFWTKIEKLIMYKHQLELEGIKKKALDKHLDFLVGQTERYSTMLAEIWMDTPTAELQPSTMSEETEVKHQKMSHVQALESMLDADHDTGKVDGNDLFVTEVQHVQGSDEKECATAPSGDMVKAEMMNSNGVINMHEKQEDLKPIDRLNMTVASFSRTSRKMNHNDLKTKKIEEDAEFSPENLEDVEDDFTTLEADEALITEEERNEELLALEKEGSLPLEELLKMYSSRRGEEEEEEVEEEEQEEEEEKEEEVHEEDEEEQQQEYNEGVKKGLEVKEEVEEDVNEEEGKDHDDRKELQGIGKSDLELQKEHITQIKVEAIPPVLGDGVESCKASSRIGGSYLGSKIMLEPPQDESSFMHSTEQGFNKSVDESSSAYNIVDAAAAAKSAQPTGFTFSTTKVRTKLPFLLKHSLREYQHIGLDWLVTMYERHLNVILADEMGLGKTIMTISLLAHLACDKGIWGPHLIVVPTSVMLNWETEFMKWCPAFKVLTYFGTAKERKVKRQGWSKANSFHVCITTYRLVIQDAKAFKRKKWKYLILDEAHLIKNWKSQRWQTLLNFNSKRRILLTGTPLQNDLMELWSLMHFLMPHIFQSHQQFRDWFNNPITGMVEGQEQINKPLVDRLHNVLRPFILRRLKADVEKQLPQKYEHVIRCRLSKRQRNLYEDFMASSDTQDTLRSGNFLGLLNVLMQLRKVCNHPDLFEGRPIISSFDMPAIDICISSAVASAAHEASRTRNLSVWNLLLSQLEFEMSAWESVEVKTIATPASLIEEIGSTGEDGWVEQPQFSKKKSIQESMLDEIQESLREERRFRNRQRLKTLIWLNYMRCTRAPLYGFEFIKQVSAEHPVYAVHKILKDPKRFMDTSSSLSELIQLPSVRFELMRDLLQAFVFAIPAARASSPVAWCSHPTGLDTCLNLDAEKECIEKMSSAASFLRPIIVRRQLFFPDRKLIQFDCGKLQELAILLRRLRSEGHRALIFTQMTKMLDILESFVNLHGYTYLRLDGSTKPEERQILMQRFNTNPKIFLFILSTRSGGVGVNLVGADTVIFYDSDWNPAMDQQAQDRCHRIGQTREVHIYRLISESTIEENILKKANQKRLLDDLVIQSGSYNTEFFKKLDPTELLSGLKGIKNGQIVKSESSMEYAEVVQGPVHELSNTEVEAALKIAEDEADYMALKKVEEEEEAENQEFTEEGYPGRMEEDECADDLEEGKIGSQSQEAPVVSCKPDMDENGMGRKDMIVLDGTLNEDVGMLADVKQIAAAAAAAGGHVSLSFDSHLRPVERYAMQFLELWDPIVDREALETEVDYEESEWELDQLERLKLAQEAEIDEDNEPLIYESWDTSCADEAYRQQLEVLKQQEYEHQLELEKMEEELQENEREDMEADYTSKWKKAKFRSLKKGVFDEATAERELELYSESEWHTPDGFFVSPPYQSSDRKRKGFKTIEEELPVEGKRFRMDIGYADDKRHIEEEHDVVKDRDSVVMLLESPLVLPDDGKKYSGLPLFEMPIKKGVWVKLDKEKRKDGSKVPCPDPWMSSEDAVFCAVVHEYGGNWLLASETLFGAPDGGIYRGRYRHPAHCKERFRQLLSKYTSIATAKEMTGDKASSQVWSSAPLRVTEEHIKQLLQAVQDLPDNEWLLQRHFISILSSEGQYGKSSKVYRSNVMKLGSSPYGRSFIRLPEVSLGSMITDDTEKFSFGVVRMATPSVELVAAALSQEERDLSAQHDKEAPSFKQDEPSHPEKEVSSQSEKYISEAANLQDKSAYSVSSVTSEVSLDLSKDHDKELSLEIEFLSQEAYYNPDFPERVGITVPHSISVGATVRADSALTKYIRRFSKTVIDQRYRLACKMCVEGESLQWAAAASSGLGVVESANFGKRHLDSGKNFEKKKRRLSREEKSINENVEVQTNANNLKMRALSPKDGYQVSSKEAEELSAGTLNSERVNASVDMIMNYRFSSNLEKSYDLSSSVSPRFSDALSGQGSDVFAIDERSQQSMLSSDVLPLSSLQATDTRRVTFRDHMHEMPSRSHDVWMSSGG